MRAVRCSPGVDDAIDAKTRQSPVPGRMVSGVEDIQLEDILREFETMLDQLGFGAIVEQERRAAEGGRVVETTKEDRARSGGPAALRPEVGDVRRTPLTSVERIAMLIDLVEAAVGGTFAIEERVMAFAYENFPFSAEEGRMPTFGPAAAEGFEVTDDREWSLPDAEILESRRPYVRRVLADLEQLREVVGVKRDPVLVPTPNDRGDVDQRVYGWA